MAAKRIEYLKGLLAEANLDPARLEMFNLSAAQGPRWARICDEFSERVLELGPSPVRAALQGMQPVADEHSRGTEGSDRG
ncbi:MAG: hydrogenase iron-sulfur subunit [Desulfohalobiaceae bacterium]|nr:hydrogenase iron-sulfur subunit [Desulfohalobiaceae bacterium]